MAKLLTRDEQIELMTTAEERHKARAANWIKDATIRSTLARPAPGQKEERESYTRSDTTVLMRYA